MKIGGHDLRERVMVVAEIGINHNGDLSTAYRMISEAANAGADAVKFQVGNPFEYVKLEHRPTPRDTPWGTMPYIEYRSRMEFSDAELAGLKWDAEQRGLIWFASPLDIGAVARLERLGVLCYKIASPMVTDVELVQAARDTHKPLLISTGMTTPAELDAVVEWGDILLHCTSQYPCPPEHNNLSVITSLQERHPGHIVGYSGHEIGIPESLAAVALGARVIERHVTLSRAMWGSDQAASLEFEGLRRMVKYIRTIETALGDGQKVVYPEESVNARKFRKLPLAT